jgi:hypothetical protein
MAFLIVGLLGGCLVAFVLVALYLRPILLDWIRRTSRTPSGTSRTPSPTQDAALSEEARLEQERMARRVETLMAYTPPTGLRPDEVRKAGGDRHAS